MGKRKKRSADHDSNLTPKEKRAKAKDARDSWLKACDAFVTNVLLPKMQDLADSHNRTMAEVRSMLSLGVGEAVKKRELRLWEAAMHVALKENPHDFKKALTEAKAVNDELKDAISANDFDNELLREYQGILAELQEARVGTKLPVTEGKTERSVQLTIGRMLDEVKLLIRNLHFATDAEYLLVVCKGNENIEFPPFVETSARVDGFLEFRMKQDARKFAIAMEGHVLWGADVFELARGQDIPHKKLFAEILGGQLKDLTSKTAKMQWSNWSSFSAKHDIELVGWPADITFKPLNLLSSSQAKRLHKLARDGTLRIQKCTPTVGNATPADGGLPTRDCTPVPPARSGSEHDAPPPTLELHAPPPTQAAPQAPPSMTHSSPSARTPSTPAAAASQPQAPAPNTFGAELRSLPPLSQLMLQPDDMSGLFGPVDGFPALSPMLLPEFLQAFPPSFYPPSHIPSIMRPHSRPKTPILPLPDHILHGSSTQGSTQDHM